MTHNDIPTAIDSLVHTLGIKDQVTGDELGYLLYAGKIKQCVKAIAMQLGLPVDVDLSYVASGSGGSKGGIFQSRHLSRTDSRGRGTAGIASQVSIPASLPLYGASDLIGYPISVKVDKEWARYHEPFIAMMAHELSHVLLHSMVHPHRDSEVWTDLTAMVLGFADIMSEARNVETVEKEGTAITTFGYLTDARFVFAHSTIRGFLRDRKAVVAEALDHIVKLRRQTTQVRKRLFQFHGYLTWLDRNAGKPTKPTDIAKIVEFHQPSYSRHVQSAIEVATRALGEGTKVCEPLDNYTDDRIRSLQVFMGRARAAIIRLSEASTSLAADLRVLRRNVGTFCRLHVPIRAMRIKPLG